MGVLIRERVLIRGGGCLLKRGCLSEGGGVWGCLLERVLIRKGVPITEGALLARGRQIESLRY